MRLFVALVPPAAVLDAVERVVAPLRRDTALRWSRREEWHVTLAFLGDVDRDRLTGLEAELGHACLRSDVGPLHLAGATEFNGRIAALGVDGDKEGLGTVARRCTNAARACGITMERRRYHPHLTVARCARPRDLRHLVTPLLATRSPSWIPQEALLLESHLSRRPEDGGELPRYETLLRVPIGR